MKRCPTIRATLHRLLCLIFSMGLALSLPAQAASVALATSPLAATTTTSVLPNVMFILDNSGSMDWEHMPDDESENNAITFAFGYYGLRSSQCNQIYFDPTLRYDPPVDAAGVEYTDANFTAARQEGFGTGTGVNLNTGFKAADTDSSGLEPDSQAQSAYYYTYSGSATTKDYNNAASDFYTECSNTTGGDPAKIAPVSGVSGKFTKHRLATTETTTITLSGSSPSSTSVSSITVNGVELMSGTSVANTSTATAATNIAAKITLNGYSATASGSIITISYSGTTSPADHVPVITQTGSMTLTPDVFPITTAPELTKFANWYSFYRTRMLMMKTAAGRAFKTLDNTYRVGLMKISASNTPVLEVGAFTGTQRSNWYSRLYATTSSGRTPLREALSNAGRYYAHKLTSVADPVQYSCQQNFSILSTDGFWNDSLGFKVDGSTNVGNQDGIAPRPMYDGALIAKTTSQTSQSQTQTTRRTSTLQGTLSKVLMRCNSSVTACGSAPTTGVAGVGSGTASWSVVTSGSCAVATSVQCQIVSGLSGTLNVSSKCNTAATINTVAGGSLAKATFTISGAASTATITNIKINGKEILSGTATTSGTSASTRNSNLAASVVTKINACTTSMSGSCQIAGYSASRSGAIVTITAPTGINITANPSVTKTGTVTWTMTFTSATSTTTHTLSNADSNGNIYSACAYTAWTTPALVASCPSDTPQSFILNNTTVTAIDCDTTTLELPHLVASCTEGNSGSLDFIQTTCTTNTLTTDNAATSCTPGNSGTPDYIQTNCAIGSGGTSDTLADVAMYYYETDLRSTATGFANCAGASSVDYPTGNTPPTYPGVCDNNVPASGRDNSVKQHMTTFTLALGANGKMVYSDTYLNPLNTTSDYHAIAVDTTAHPTGVPTADPPTPPVCTWGVEGELCNWPTPGILSGGVCDPTLALTGGCVENIDDLWHAAVNGRGIYYSATSPTALSQGLSEALLAIKAKRGAAAAAATSTLNPVAGNNFAYVASYTTLLWKGNLESREINTGVCTSAERGTSVCPAPAYLHVNAGQISETATWCVESITQETCVSPGVSRVVGSNTYCDTPDTTGTDCAGTWDSVADTCTVALPNTCSGTLPAMVSASSDTRKIYTANYTATSTVNNLVEFDATYATDNAGYFDTSLLTQWATLNATQRTAATTTSLINYLRGRTGNEMTDPNDPDAQLYRAREAVMGDALESQPAYVSKPVFNYTDPGFNEFKASHASRAGTVYIGANDGMMHAFNAADGVERWAYVPSMVIPNMWKLANSDYSGNHVNYVNGSPMISDICTANCDNANYASTVATTDDPVWKTILVGGLNGGGRGYYALDITETNTSYPKLLWEFTDTNGDGAVKNANLGYSFGNPVITKKADGTWVVLVTSGYNNTGPGDGNGYLYTLNADTGAIISSLPTGVGDTTTPSGLAKIATRNDAPGSNQAGFTYGGDLRGNLWRFDINAAASTISPQNPLKLATLKDPSSVAQPITTSPVLGDVNGKHVVFIGTGKYLETSDLTDEQVQSLYAIKDDNTGELGDPRSSMVEQTMSNNGVTRSVPNAQAVNFTTGRGWYIDFPDVGERVNIDGQLVLGTLIAPSIVPSPTICSPGGYGWLNYFDYATGGAVRDIVSQKYESPIVGVNVIYIAGKPIIEVVTATNPTPEQPPVSADFANGPGGFSSKRVIWRELTPP